MVMWTCTRRALMQDSRCKTNILNGSRKNSQFLSCSLGLVEVLYFAFYGVQNMMGLMDKELLLIELPEDDRHVTVHDVSDGGANQGLVKVGE